MAGWGTVFAPADARAFGGRILNTHPALLPAFKGWHAVRDALAVRGEGHRLHGARRHRRGRRRSDPRPGGRARCAPTTPRTTLHERIKAVERRLYPDTIRKVSTDPAKETAA